jgi:hypothetical protein
MSRLLPCLLALGAAAALPAAQTPSAPAGAPGSGLIERVTTYVRDYEQRFSALVAEERYVQLLEARATQGGIGGSLSQANPGGGMSASRDGRVRRVLKSDYLIARLDEGGWMPFRDVYEVDGSRVADRNDRLATASATTWGRRRVRSAFRFSA